MLPRLYFFTLCGLSPACYNLHRGLGEMLLDMSYGPKEADIEAA